MDKQECTEFLQWCLPQLRMCWSGFRKVRQQVCKRISRRLRELNLPNSAAYKNFLQTYPEEWQILDRICRITISRFYRDRGVFDILRFEALPTLAKKLIERGETEARCWSAGCGSGEEPYSLQIIWRFSVLPQISSKLPLQIIATDIDAFLLKRARKGCYAKGSLKELPRDWIGKVFYSTGEEFCLRREFTDDIVFLQQDVREKIPEGSFHLILCRNLIFTYYEASLQEEILRKMLDKLLPGGFLIVGIHESLPEGVSGIPSWYGRRCIYHKRID